MNAIAKDLFGMFKDTYSAEGRREALAQAYEGVEGGLSEEDVDDYAGRFGPIKTHPPDFIYREALEKAQRKIGFHAPTIQSNNDQF